MADTRNEILQARAGLERLADESQNIEVVRGAYKLIRQIEEFVQQLPDEGGRTRVSASETTVPRKQQKGKPGRKKLGRPSGKATKGRVENGNEVNYAPKKRGRKPGKTKQEETTSETGE